MVFLASNSNNVSMGESVPDVHNSSDYSRASLFFFDGGSSPSQCLTEEDRRRSSSRRESISELSPRNNACVHSLRFVFCSTNNSRSVLSISNCLSGIIPPLSRLDWCSLNINTHALAHLFVLINYTDPSCCKLYHHHVNSLVRKIKKKK